MFGKQADDWREGRKDELLRAGEKKFGATDIAEQQAAERARVPASVVAQAIHANPHKALAKAAELASSPPRHNPVVTDNPQAQRNFELRYQPAPAPGMKPGPTPTTPQNVRR